VTPVEVVVILVAMGTVGFVWLAYEIRGIANLDHIPNRHRWTEEDDTALEDLLRSNQ
jgi:hypothetical protein